MHNNENSFSFLKDRITEIRSALMYSMSNELVKIPTSIISILKIDDNGQLWFFIKRPTQVMHDTEKSFPARLQFYRKGKPFYMNVAGCAGVDENPALFKQLADETASDIHSANEQNMMLVKLKITRVEYHEQKQFMPKQNFWKNTVQNLSDAIFKPTYQYRPLEITTEFA